MYCRVGVAGEALSEMRNQFTSALMKEVSRLVSIKIISSTPYHPSCIGLVEKMSGILNKKLNRLAVEKSKDRDRYLIVCI